MVVSFSSLIVNIQLTHEGWGLPRGLGCKVESHQRAEDCVAVLALGQATLSLARRERWPLTARQGATELWTTDGYGASESHMMLVPSELRARRRALGLTQVQLAAVLGVAGNTVARWERGERPVGTPGVVRPALERARSGWRSRLARASAGPGRHRFNAGSIGGCPFGGDAGATRSPVATAPRGIRQPPHRVVGRVTHWRVRLLLGAARLLTLVGPAGIGKTRLALEVATERAAQSPGAVQWVELAPIADGDQVPRAVAALFGIV